MLFVSKSPELSIVVRRDVVRNVVNTHGQTEAQSVVPVLYANFVPKALSGPQRTRADARFRQINPTHPYGATPYSDPGIMGSQFNEEEISPSQPEAFVGFSPVHMLGKFDTAVDINYAGQPEPEAEVRKMVEEFLLLPEKGLNDIYILLDGVSLEKPWPNYPLEGQGRHKTIEAAVRQLGIDPRIVVEFEEAQETPGTGVISTMQALIAEFDSERAEHDALSAVIPG
jgi:hypothetical protein